MGKKATAATATAAAAAVCPTPPMLGGPAPPGQPAAAVIKGSGVAPGCNRISVMVGPVAYWYDVPFGYKVENLKEMIEEEPQGMRGKMTFDRIVLTTMTGELLTNDTFFAENVKHVIKCTLTPLPKVSPTDKTPKIAPKILKGASKPGNPTSIGRYYPKRTVQTWSTEEEADSFMEKLKVEYNMKDNVDAAVKKAVAETKAKANEEMINMLMVINKINYEEAKKLIDATTKKDTAEEVDEEPAGDDDDEEEFDPEEIDESSK